MPHPTPAPISPEQAQSLAHSCFGITGTAQALPGEVDLNFKLTTPSGEAYILKISRPGADPAYLDFQVQILEHPGQVSRPGVSQRQPVDYF